MAAARPPLDDPRLLPYLPLIYLAWSDGELSATEVSSICEEFERFEGIDGDCKHAFNRWLDPEDPPTPADLGAMLDTIRSHLGGSADTRYPEPRPDLAELAERVTTSGRDGSGLTPAELAALRTLMGRLGMEGSEPARLVLSRATTEAKPTAPPPLDERPFDPVALSRIRDGRRYAIRQEMRRLLADPGFAHSWGSSIAEQRARVFEQVQRLAGAGLGGLGFPEEFGGRGTSSDFLGAFSLLGHHDLSLLTKFGVQFGLFGGAIFRLGTEHHHRTYLPDVISLALPGCFAMTETDHGSNVQALETTATFDPVTDSFTITTPHPGAAKDYIGNAALHGRAAVVFAQLSTRGQRYGVHAFVVPIRDHAGNTLSGIRIEDDGPKAGLNGVDNGRISFDQVRVGRSALLNRFGSVAADGTYSSPIPSDGKRFFATIGTLVGGRVGVGTASISAAETALTIAIRYGNRRRQFGAAGAPESVVLDYPAHQRRLLPRLATTYAFRFALERLIDEYADGVVDQREIETTAAGLKALATWHAADTIRECREACGGAGYLAVNRLGPLHADADVLQTFEGDNTVLSLLVARSLLSGYAQQFNDLSPLGTVRFLANRALAVVREANPIVWGGADEDDLLNRDRQRHLLRWRAEHLLAALAGRMKKRIDSGADPTDAFTQLQPHAIAAARAHVEQLVLDAFARQVQSLPDGPERAAIDVVCSLHALSRIEADLGWFQEHGGLSAGAAKAVRRLVTRLCGDVRPIAVALSDAMAIPDEVIGAPIAT